VSQRPSTMPTLYEEKVDQSLIGRGLTKADWERYSFSFY
jgi:hypothetical protein